SLSAFRHIPFPPPPCPPLSPYTTLFRSLDQVVVATAPADRPQLFRPVEQLEDSARVVGEASDDREIDFDEFGQPHSSERRDHRRSEEHTSELQSRGHLVCRLLLEKKTAR